MAKKKKATKLKCSECGSVNYHTFKTNIMKEEKLELKKFCVKCKKHTLHKESKR